MRRGVSNEAVEWTTSVGVHGGPVRKARLGGYAAVLWLVGGENPWRGLVYYACDGIAPPRTTSHHGEDSGRRTLEAKLRRLAKKEQGR